MFVLANSYICNVYLENQKLHSKTFFRLQKSNASMCWALFLIQLKISNIFLNNRMSSRNTRRASGRVSALRQKDRSFKSMSRNKDSEHGTQYLPGVTTNGTDNVKGNTNFFLPKWSQSFIGFTLSYKILLKLIDASTLEHFSK